MNIRTVLFIDDSRVSRMKLRQLVLQQHPDWQLLEAGCGKDGLQTVAGITPDLITVDINMPGMGGFAAAEQLRKVVARSHIVILSGNIQGSSKHRAEELGAFFVEKPITEASVAKVLACLEGGA